MAEEITTSNSEDCLWLSTAAHSFLGCWLTSSSRRLTSPSSRLTSWVAREASYEVPLNPHLLVLLMKSQEVLRQLPPLNGKTDIDPLTFCELPFCLRQFLFHRDKFLRMSLSLEVFVFLPKEIRSPRQFEAGIRDLKAKRKGEYLHTPVDPPAVYMAEEEYYSWEGPRLRSSPSPLLLSLKSSLVKRLLPNKGIGRLLGVSPRLEEKRRKGLVRPLEAKSVEAGSSLQRGEERKEFDLLEGDGPLLCIFSRGTTLGRKVSFHASKVPATRERDKVQYC
ncbi:hypothetical protein LIER_11738 [Lithospermum erythrorhizon]|uniref:Uncharacterized protein n=1 Tax=Lithospermum erythrorhizon TaxID=34254 RepID=A0AAV3PU91_LITER